MNTLLSSSTLTYTRLACDRNRSVLGNSGLQRAYTPFGHVPPGGAALAFNGERPECAAGHYVLGQGYRAYSPALMRFERADDASPFGKGGINSYAYCGAEPINHTDSSGHSAMFGMLGILAGAILMAWGGIERASGNESKSNLLLGIGGGVMAIGIFGTAVGSIQVGRTSRSSTSRAVDAALTGPGSPVNRGLSTVARKGSVGRRSRDISSANAWTHEDDQIAKAMSDHPTLLALRRQAVREAREQGVRVSF